MQKAIRGGQSFDPYSQLQPAEPFLRDDRDDVGQALPAGDAAFLDEDQPQQASLTERVLDGGPRAAGERGDRVDGKDADASPLTLAGDDRQDGQLGHGERGGDLPRNDPRHSLPTASLKRGSAIGRPRASGGPGKAKGRP